jgi:hypothetical protein
MSPQLIWQAIVSLVLVGILAFLTVIWAIVRELEPVDPTDLIDVAPLFTGGCFRVKAIPPPTAHAAVDNEFCIQESAGFWTLTPGNGMGTWHSVAGPKEIPLTDVHNDPGVFVGYFDFIVDGHPPKPPSSHGGQHGQPDFQFMVRVNSGTKVTAVIRPRRNTTTTGGPPVHGGSAHADEF